MGTWLVGWSVGTRRVFCGPVHAQAQDWEFFIFFIDILIVCTILQDLFERKGLLECARQQE